MIDESEKRKINILRYAISENIQYKDLPEDFKEKYSEDWFRGFTIIYKSFKKHMRKKIYFNYKRDQ